MITRFSTTVAIAALLCTHAIAADPKDRAKPWTVCAPVRSVTYDVDSSDTGGVTVALAINPDDLGWESRSIYLPADCLYIDGKKATRREVLRWLPAAAKPDLVDGRRPVELVEVTITFKPNVYGGVVRVDFRVVPYLKHYWLEEARNQVVFFFRRRGIDVERECDTAVAVIRAAMRVGR